MDELSLTPEGEERVEELTNQAELFDMRVDWETLSLEPKKFTKINYWTEANSERSLDDYYTIDR